ncbi:aminotransferase class V-fold PLP-dependent enzyme, partial [Vibrio fluvialis]
DALNVKGTVRVSFGIYNTAEDVDRLIAAVDKAVDML